MNFSKNSTKIKRGNGRVMTILQTKFYPIPVVIENMTANAHITHLSLSGLTVRLPV